MLKRRFGSITLESSDDWMRLRYRRGGVFEELYLDAEDGSIETVRRTAKGESSAIDNIMMALPSVVKGLERDETLKQFSMYVRAYFDAHKPRIERPVLPSMPQHVVCHEPAGSDGRVFFFRSGDVYEELEVRVSGEVFPMQLRLFGNRVLRTPRTLEMLDALHEFMASMDVNPDLRPYRPILEQYCQQQVQ